MPIFEINGRKPVFGKNTWIAPTAEIIGDVRISDNCYIGYGAILRGDYGTIIIGEGTAIEEGVMIHARPGDKTEIGCHVTIGHKAMLHNTTIMDYAVVGMNSTVTDFSVVGEWSIIGEQSLVKRGQQIPPNKIYAGVPAVEKRDVEDKNRTEWMLAKKVYVELAKQNLKGLHNITDQYIFEYTEEK